MNDQPNRTGERWFVGISLGLVCVVAIGLAVAWFLYQADQAQRVQEVSRAQTELAEQQIKALK